MRRRACLFAVLVAGRESRQLAAVVAATLFADQRWAAVLHATGGIDANALTHDGAHIGALVLSDDVPRILATLSAIVREPRCDEGNLASAKAQVLQLSARNPRLAIRAEAALHRTIVAADSVYAFDDGARAATCADVSAFALAYLKADRLAVIVSGNTSPQVAMTAAREGFGSLRARSIASPSGSVLPARAVTTVAHPGSTFTAIDIGRFILATNDDNALRARLVASLSDSIESALRNSGLAYAVHGSLYQSAFGYELILATVVPSSETVRALSVIVDTIEMAPFEMKPHSEAMYTWREAHLQGAILRQQQAQGQGAALGEAFLAGRPFVATFRDIEEIAKADIDDALAWAREQIDLAGLSFVLAGDPQVIELALSSAGLH